MGFEWCASVRGFGPASAAILASAALGAGLTVLAGAGPTAAAVRPAVVPHASARLAAELSGAGRAARGAAPDGTISTVAGGVGGPAAATSVNLGVSTPIASLTSSPCGVSFGQGQLLVADNWTVRRISPVSGGLTTPVGTAASGPFGDGGPATGTSVDTCAVVADAAGNLVIADVANDRIRVVPTATGTIYGQQMTAGDVYTVAGTGTYGFSGDGGPATSAQLSDPASVAVDAAGNLVITSNSANRVQVIADQDGSYYGQPMTGGDIYTIAGDGTPGYTGDGGPAASATLDGPQGVTVDGAGNLVIADTGNSAIRVIAGHDGTFYGQPMTAGDIYTIAGDGTAGYTGDGGPAISSQVSVPAGVAADAAGNLVIADTGNNAIRVIAAGTGTFYGQPMTTGDIYTIAGTGTAGYTGDGNPAARAELNAPQGLTVDGSGNVVIADTGNYRVRVVAAGTGTFYGKQMTAGDIYTVAGGNNTGLIGDGGPATATRLSLPYGATVDAAGNLVIADTGNNRIRVIATASGSFYGQHDDRRRHLHRSPAPAPGLLRRRPPRDGGQAQRRGRGRRGRGREPGARGHRQQQDPGRGGRHRHVLRPADDRRDIYTVAGTGTAGYTGDGGPAASARLRAPVSVTMDANGNLVIADSGNNVIRVIASQDGTFYGQPMTSGDIYTIAGTGTAGYTGDGGPATSATLYYPQGVTADSAGNLVIADTGNNVIRVVAGQDGTFYGQPMTAGNIYTDRRHRRPGLLRRRRPGHQRRADRPGQRDGGRRREPGHCRLRRQPGPGRGGQRRQLLRPADDRRRHLHDRRHRSPGLLRRRRPGHQRHAALPAGRDGGRHRGRAGDRFRQQPGPDDHRLEPGRQDRPPGGHGRSARLPDTRCRPAGTRACGPGRRPGHRRALRDAAVLPH